MQVVLRPAPPSVPASVRGLWESVSPGGSMLARNRPLRVMFFAGLISGLGDRLNVVALAALVLALTGSMTQAGLVFVVSTLPYVLFGLIAGTLVDRWDRRVCMVGADLARAALVAAIPLAAVVSLPLVYALLFAATCAKMVFTPAQQAAIPDVVERGDLLTANATVRMGQYLTDVFGYPIAGTLVALLANRLGTAGGAYVAFGIDAASFVLSAALLWRLRLGAARPRAASVPAAKLGAEVTAGLRFLAGHPALRANTILLTVGPLLLGSLHTLHVGFAWNVAHADARGYGVLQSAMGVGVVIGVWAVQRLARATNKGRLILLGFFLYGASILLTGLTGSLPIAAALAAVNGAGNILFIIPSVTLVQQHTPAEMRGRIFGVRASLTYTAFALSNALVGALLAHVGVGAMMVLLGGGVLAMTAIACCAASAREAA